MDIKSIFSMMFINRPVKFRSWDRVNKIMSSWEDLDNSFTNSEYSLAKVLEHEDTTQFTGYLDKDKTEIYVGDIIDYEDVACDGGGDGEIHRKLITCLEDWIYFIATMRNIEMENIKVVGNRFQNPELLNKDVLQID